MERRWNDFKAVHVKRHEWINDKINLSAIQFNAPHFQRYELSKISSSTILLICTTPTNEEEVEVGNAEEQAGMYHTFNETSTHEKQMVAENGNATPTNEDQVKVGNAKEKTEINHTCIICPKLKDKGRRPRGMCRFNNCFCSKGNVKRRRSTMWICKECQFFLHPECFDEYHKKRKEYYHRHARSANKTVYKIIGSKA